MKEYKKPIITSLDLSNLGLTSIEGIQYLSGLMNLNLSDPENVLADYISGGQKNSRIVSVDADLKTGQLKKLIYENKFVKVSLTVDEDGTRNMEEDTMDKAD